MKNDETGQRYQAGRCPISMVCSDANTTSDTEEGEQCVECDIEEVAIPSHGEVLDMLSNVCRGCNSNQKQMLLTCLCAKTY